MSYEGYQELLCKTGHLVTYSCYECYPSECPTCGKKWTHCHDVDTTNGYVENNPNTYPAKTKIIENGDVWHTDHYGNEYALKENLFGPDSPEWIKL